MKTCAHLPGGRLNTTPTWWLVEGIREERSESYALSSGVGFVVFVRRCELHSAVAGMREERENLTLILKREFCCLR
jgi:hypothetical protein